MGNLRQEQRSIATKTNELQQDLNEHNIVIETLNGVDGDRKCFRMVGGVLVERTVKEVVPALVNNRDKMGKLIGSLEKQLTEKGEEPDSGEEPGGREEGSSSGRGRREIRRSSCLKMRDDLAMVIFAMLACVILPDLSRTVRSLQDLLIVQNTLTLEK